MDQNAKEAQNLFKTYEGINYPSLIPGNVEDHLNDLQNLEIRSDDVIIASYPRSGTHWTYEIVRMLISADAKHQVDEARKRALDFNSVSSLQTLESPRILLTHLTSKYMPKEMGKCRVLYVARNPKDVLVSAYHVHNTHVLYKGTKDWETDLNDFLEGTGLYGSWFDHIHGWASLAESKSNVQMVIYEDLKRDLKTGVKRIAEFLNIDCDQKLINDISEACNFKSLKHFNDNNMNEEMKKRTTTGTSLHYRKGVVGDWKNLFTVAQNELFDKIYAEKMEKFSRKLDFV